ncbi:hypothetical protein [Methylomonas rhizoryzae]|uniref:hypothetical protein n=1 Tax=Methylomonas rhizoryzae TaxID=2608981 RepID=UPI001231FD70|nr:hypothetical protein [Methylomonas rhizoryzae]
MTAQYYEAVAEIPLDHCLHLQLPPEIPAGPVRVAIIYDRAIDTAGQDIKNLLAAMPNFGDDADFNLRYGANNDRLFF